MPDQVFWIEAQDKGKRLDTYLSEVADEELSLTRSHLQKLILHGDILVNGSAQVKSYKLRANDCVTVCLPEPEAIQACPQEIPLEIVYEDNALLVVNKPRGMVVHPAPGNSDGTLVNALLFHCGDSLSGINGVLRPGIVHRIDKDTSGLLVVAKNDLAHAALARQIAEHSMSRQYAAVVHGCLDQEGTVDQPIGRDPRDRKKYCVIPQGKPAVTHYCREEIFDRFSYVTCRLETGRTHQIRVHMAYIRHPVAGDPIYAPRHTPKLGGQCLHAQSLGFIHPETGEYMQFQAALPAYFTEFLNGLRGQIDGKTQ